MATEPLPRDRSKESARSPEELDEEVRRYLQGRSRRSFLAAGAAALAGLGLYEGIYRAHAVNGLQWPLRKVAEGNRLLTNAIFRQSVPAPTYSAGEVTGLRVNGDYGIDTGLLLDSWGLRVSGLQGPERYSRFLRNVNEWEYRSTGATTAPESAQPDVKSRGGAAPPAKDAAGRAGGTVPHLQESTDVSASAEAVPGIVLRLADLRALPYTEQITQFKCVEGWSQIVRWGGVRFSDFLRAFPPGDVDGAPPKFATMETADGAFNASFDMQSLLHPQTLLCYTMDGRALERYHGAPLRLAMPLKYGYKQIKAVASIAYGNVRTPDYWEKLGYDWYAGL